MKKLLVPSAALSILAMATIGYGEDILVPISLDSGAASFDEQGDASNLVLSIDLGLGPNVVFNGIGWDMTLETVGASWASEATLGMGRTTGEVAVYLSPGTGVDEPLLAPTTYISGGVVRFEDVDEIDRMLLPDGILRIEFFEVFDDEPDLIDAEWLVGSTVNVNVDACPEDTNGDGVVDVDDLINLILDWGTDGSTTGGDVNLDSVVDVDDLVSLIVAWGPCPSAE